MGVVSMGESVGYRYEATSVEGFVQQLAVCYLRNRYWFYVLGEIPAGKDPSNVDGKLLGRYAIDQSKWAKARARKHGFAKVQYLRYRTTFVLVATEGEHTFFDDEKDNIRDARERPVRFYGYSIGYKDGHPFVRIATAQYRELVEAFLNSALTTSGETLAARFKALPFEPYGPVKVQLRRLLQRVNEVRRTAGHLRCRTAPLRRRRLELPDDRGALRLCGHFIAEPLRCFPKGRVVQQARACDADRFDRRVRRERQPGPALGDAHGVVALVAPVRDHEHRDAAQKRPHDRP